MKLNFHCLPKYFSLGIIFSFSVHFTCLGQSTTTTFNSCHGESRPLLILSNMPYTSVKVGNAEGMFLVDFGTTGSTIDTNGFSTGGPPRSIPGAPDKFDNFDFYGSWGTVNLSLQDHSGIQGLGTHRQAGILGTDFLSLHAFTLDYLNGRIYRSSQKMCNDSVLRSEGFLPASTSGYYSSDFSRLKPGAVNIPTVPVRIGTTDAVAQIDPGFDDRLYHHSVNINRAFFDAIKSEGITLARFNTADLRLSTCIVGTTETVEAYRMPTNTGFQIIGTDGQAIIVANDAVIFLKNPPATARVCGGVGTWETPAAQIGASFLVDSRQVLFDPYNSLVWFNPSARRPQLQHQQPPHLIQGQPQQPQIYQPQTQQRRN